MRLVTFDIEIAIEVEKLKNKWADAKLGRAGVASVVLYDTISERYHIYDTRTLDKCFDHLNAADLLLGFNNIDFDTPALCGFAQKKILPPQIDILQEVRKVLGKPFVKGYGLDPICERTLGLTKSGEGGAMAPILYQTGRFAELHDYNLNDVYLTRKLHNFIVDNGYIIGINGEPLYLSGYPKEKA